MILGFGGDLYAQATAPVDITVCDVVKKPQAFNGQIVRIKGTVVAGFDEFVIKDSTDSNCGYPVNAIWLAYPPGTKGKAGPAAMLTIEPARNFTGKYTPATRAAVTLDKSKDFKQFDSLLAQKHEKGADMCLGCTRYEVTATLVGRLDSVADATLQRDASGKIVGFGGFGNMNAYPARLVLESVSDVTPKEIDYSKNDDETKRRRHGRGKRSGHVWRRRRLRRRWLRGWRSGERNGSEWCDCRRAKEPPTSLPRALRRTLQQRPRRSMESRTTIRRASTVAYGTGNEASPKDEDLGTKDSPDGVLFNCTFNQDRVQGDSLARAVIHMGEHISELRNPVSGNEAAPPYILESDAWVVTAVSAVVGGQKFLSMPGGYVIWDFNWPAADRNDKMAAALKDFLLNEAILSQ